MIDLLQCPRRWTPLYTLAALAAQACLWPTDRADAGHEIFHIFTPMIERGHWGLELNNGFQSGFPDQRDEPNDADVRSASELGLHADLTDFWMTKVALDFEREVGGDYELAAVASENVFRMDKWTPRSIDVGWFTSLSAAVSSEGTNSIEFGPVVTLTSGAMALALNPFFEKTFGQNREEGLAFVYAYRATYSFSDLFSIGVEGYGEIEDIENAPPTSDQVHRMGPVLYFGTVHGMDNHSHDHEGHGSELVNLHELELDHAEWYAEIGVLFGLTDNTSDAALKLNAGLHF